MARVDSGPSQLLVKRFTYDASIDGTAAAVYTLGSIPDNAIVVRSVIDVPTAFTSPSGTPTVAVGIAVSHVIESGNWNAVPWTGLTQTTTDTAFPYKTDAARAVTLTIGTTAVGVGVVHLWLEYYQGA
jgi:hypothetical protein